MRLLAVIVLRRIGFVARESVANGANAHHPPIARRDFRRRPPHHVLSACTYDLIVPVPEKLVVNRYHHPHELDCIGESHPHPSTSWRTNGPRPDTSIATGG